MKQRYLWILAAVMPLGLAAVLAYVYLSPKPPIPEAIKNQVTSTILVPTTGSFTVEQGSAKYDKTQKLLSFKIKKGTASVATISEQPTPETFTDIPEFGTKLFQQAGEYKTFESVNGTVHLLHPNKGVKTAAAMNAKGTLMFVNPDVSFSEDDWRRLFQSMVVVQ